MRIGFIGLGIMGSRMAANILRGGHQLTVYNRSPEKARSLVAAGAVLSSTPAEAAGEAEIVMSMLSDPTAVRAAASGNSGFLAGMKQGSLWIDCSTVHPQFTHEMADLAGEHGVRFVDAPVAGTKMPAEKGELIVLVGGADADVLEARPVLELVGKKIAHIGGVGMGTSMKLVTNVMLANAMASFAEAAALGQSLGLSPAAIFDTVLGGGAAAPFLSAKRAKFEANDYEPDFPLRLMRKDLHLAAIEAFNAGIALPTTNAAKELFGMATKNGMGDLDFSALYRLLNDTLN